MVRIRIEPLDDNIPFLNEIVSEEQLPEQEADEFPSFANDPINNVQDAL